MYRLVIYLIFVLMVIGCSTVRVTSDYDSDVDFTGLQSYSWLEIEAQSGEDVRINNEFVKHVVRKSVDKVMKEKGYVRVNEEKADFQITWLGAIDKKMQADSISHFYRPYGYGSLYRDPNWSKDENLKNREFEEGTLIIDFLDPTDHKIIWRGIGSEKIDGEGTEADAKRKINKVITRILKTIPSKK